MKAPISVKHKGETHNGMVPTSWEDLSLKDFYDWTRWAMTPEKDFVKMYELMTGIPYDVLFKSRESSVQVAIDTYLEFLWKDPKDAALHTRPIPKKIKMLIGIHNKELKVPQKIELKQLGQKYAIQIYFNSMKDDCIDQVDYQMKRAAGIIAVFMYQEITGKSMDEDFDMELAMAYIPRVLSLPAVEAIPLSVFFWNHLNASPTNGTSNSLKNRLLSKFKRILKN